MRFIDLWQTRNTGDYVLFQASVLETLAAYRQNSSCATEAGGVLLGYVRGDHLEVVQATKPQEEDTRLRTRFERSARAHQVIADRLWKESDGLIRYLGEWHTHPEDIPSPSSVDINGWAHRASVRQDGRATLSVIVGRMGMYIALVDKNKDSIVYEKCNSNA